MIRASRCLALAACACAAACAPRVVAGTMVNPARSKDKIEAAQEFDLGPYKENHRYSMTVKDWTPQSIGVEIKLAEIGDCALPTSYANLFRASGTADDLVLDWGFNSNAPAEAVRWQHRVVLNHETARELLAVLHKVVLHQADARRRAAPPPDDTPRP